MYQIYVRVQHAGHEHVLYAEELETALVVAKEFTHDCGCCAPAIWCTKARSWVTELWALEADYQPEGWYAVRVFAHDLDGGSVDLGLNGMIRDKRGRVGAEPGSVRDKRGRVREVPDRW